MKKIPLLSCIFLSVTSFFAIANPPIISWDQGFEKKVSYNYISNPNEMLYAQYHWTGTGISASSNLAKPVKIWRITDRYARLEEPYNPTRKVLRLSICSEPDTWDINLIDKTGVYSLDTDNSVGVPLLTELRLPVSLEVGKEVYYFKNNDALEEKDEKNNTISYTLQSPALKLVLLTDNHNIPKKLSVFPMKNFNTHQSFSIVYDDYKIKLKPDLSLFKVPENIKITTKSTFDVEQERKNAQN